jgi:hypothetical protein
MCRTCSVYLRSCCCVTATNCHAIECMLPPGSDLSSPWHVVLLLLQETTTSASLTSTSAVTSQMPRLAAARTHPLASHVAAVLDLLGITLQNYVWMKTAVQANPVMGYFTQKLAAVRMSRPLEQGTAVSASQGISGTHHSSCVWVSN